MRNRWLAPLLIIAMFAFGIAAWPWLPDQIDSHWGLSGEADDTMSRTWSVILLPSITLGLWALLLVLPRIDPKKENYDRFNATYRLIVNGTVALMALIHFAVIGNGLGWDMPVVRIIMIAMGLFFAVLGNEMGRIRPNWFAGIRTPWTLADDEVWRRTHRVGGRVFVLTGIAIAVLAAFAPPPVIVIALLGGTTAMAIGLTLYSYILWRRRQAESTPASGR
jgi:uncharacterized membrane protein